MVHQRMTWYVEYTEAAREDLRNVLGYISNVLLEPVTAARQVTRIMDATDSLGL